MINKPTFCWFEGFRFENVEWQLTDQFPFMNYSVLIICATFKDFTFIYWSNYEV